MNFKRVFPSLICGSMLLFSVSAAADAPSGEASSGGGNLANMGRGLVNIVTCFLEVPRCMVYRNSEQPFWGLIAGAVNGVGCTAMRAVTGVTDVLFLGFDRGAAFDRSFRTYVWDSRWLPAEPEKAPAAKPDAAAPQAAQTVKKETPAR